MIPIGDDNSCRRGAAWLTWTIIALNCLVFIFIQGFGTDAGVISAYAAVPAELLSGKDVVSATQRLLDPFSGRLIEVQGLARTPIPIILTLFTSMFLHGGLAHLLGNMLFLAVFGDNVECRIGRLRYLALYLGAGIVGTFVHAIGCAVLGEGLYTPMVGASGAISGIMAAYLVLFPGNRVTVLMFGFLPTALHAWVVIGLWFVMQVVGGLSDWSAGGVAYAAHLGGFAIGWLWARRYRKSEARRLAAEREALLRRGLPGRSYWWIIE